MKNKIIPDELEWQEGNVKNFFGKELLSLNNGILKLAKSTPSALYPEHLHPDKTKFAYVLNGHPHFKTGSHEFDAVPGEFYIFSTNVKHAIQNRNGSECVLLLGSIKKLLIMTPINTNTKIAAILRQHPMHWKRLSVFRQSSINFVIPYCEK